MHLSIFHHQLIVEFQKEQVDFILIGGHAAIIHGVRRATSDIDILVKPDRLNGNKIISALKKLKLDTTDITPSDFSDQLVLSFGEEPNAVEIMNYIIGVDIDEVFEEAIQLPIDSLILKIIDIRHLLKNKEALNRTGIKELTDKQDILTLRKILKLDD